MARVAKATAAVLVLVSLAVLVPVWACGGPGGGIHRPVEQSTVSGTTTVELNVTSETEVAGVDLYVDDNYTATDAEAPYSIDWDTTKVANGAHRVSAKIRAKERPDAQLQAVSVTVKNAK